MAAGINQDGFDRRMAVVKRLLQSLNLQAVNLSTIAYDTQYAYPFNSFLYRVELAIPASSSVFPGTQPGTTPAPPGGVSTLVVKLSNLAAEGINNANRVQNDVAAQHIVRQSMARAGLAPLVPAVYAWAPATTNDDVKNEEGFGWIMLEWRSGVDLDAEFSTLEADDKTQVLKQVAAIFKAIQGATLPETVTKFGGLTFDASGRIMSAEAPRFQCQPVETYAHWRVFRLRKQLEQAAKSPVIQGWKRNNVDARIEKFLASGGPEKVLRGVDLNRKNLIHGDFTTNNMLFDKATNKITAILDFDWSFVSHPFDEFTSSLSDLGGKVTLDDDDEVERAILSGDFFAGIAEEPKEKKDKWQLAKTFSAAMQEARVTRPSDMLGGADKIRDLLLFQGMLCPFRLGNEFMLKQLDDAKKAELRDETEARLVKWLENHGF
ncbi:hypothetical protein JDV02_008088 [Purpureocillium takamizusanense]|uniref:non-specific serine/threonine protein kinase n=1 Tax=Purpureocillium takamizusanense TaxID=2060973 RepID=A0A9Q8VCZ0_9HYPO|nr:uncharacterized protein JDV02_008088 [Purpureocillium takamizusanense]UNI22175.1 hypothetical protein JDV02_008088 [Purpureocillium takamizusanense]